MDEKNLIERLVEENKSLSKKLRKLSSRGKSFVMENEKQFTDLLRHIQNFESNGKSRYFFERKNKKGTGSEQVFKLNTFVADLIEFKARSNVAPEMVNSRISMDKGSLIRSLEEGRIKRPRGDAGILARDVKMQEKIVKRQEEILTETKELWAVKEKADKEKIGREVLSPKPKDPISLAIDSSSEEELKQSGFTGAVEKAQQTAEKIEKLLEDPAPAVRSMKIEDDEAKETGKRRTTKRFQKEEGIAPPKFE